MGDNLKKSMLGALKWTTINIVGAQAFQLIVGIILARILMPAEFGLVGVLFFFIGLSTVFIDGGFGQGLIRKKDAVAKDFNTIFFLNLTVSIVFYIILYLSAPLIADFFHQPELIHLARVLFLSVIIFSFYYIQQIQLLKKLDYKSQAIINMSSIALSGILAVILASRDYGVWALVFQQLSFHTIKTLLFPFFFKWKPKFEFSISTVQELWKYSVNLLGQFFLNVVFNNIYTILIGRFFNLQQVGYFNQANRYSETVNTATQNILSTGTFPAFAQIQDDQPRLLRIYRKLTTTVSVITFPLVIMLIIVARPLIITLITEKWIESIVLFQLLLLANLFTPVYTININILNARGESGNTLLIEIIKKALIVISILICFQWGLKVMLTGFVVANFIGFAVSAFYLKKSLNHYYRHQFLDMFSKLAIAVSAGIIAYFLRVPDVSEWLQLLVQVVMYVLFYITITAFIYQDEYVDVVQKIISRLKKK